MPDGNRIGDKAPLVTNSSEEDSHDEMSTREAEDEDDQVLIDLSQSDLRRNNSSNLWTSASQHTTGNSNSFQHSSGSTLRPYSAAHQQKSSVSTAATDMGEHSNAEDDSYSSSEAVY
ncbi:uncharacterized protein LOC134839930 [Symsagittifera roscoffensis]|uniref:uncharacterized protein LOC134839930 n=1 Tax=Symsagittifera roscoffensis TaxID=84072 RepID=UPI00307B685E